MASCALCSHLKSGHYFHGSLYLTVSCSMLVWPEEYRYADNLGGWYVSASSAMMGPTADTCSRQLGYSWTYSRIFCVKMETRTLRSAHSSSAMLGTSVDTRSSRGFWKFLHIFHLLFSAPEVDPRPALLPSLNCFSCLFCTWKSELIS